VNGPTLGERILFLARQWVREGLAAERGIRTDQITQQQVEDALNKIPIRIDSIGVGVSVYDYVHARHPNTVAMTGSGASTAKDKTGHFRFRNAKTEWWWKFRESLDPQDMRGVQIPKSLHIRQQLITPRYDVGANNTLVMEKGDSIKSRLGYSPDMAVAIINAASSGKRKSSIIGSAIY
jgi:hypothetical protein